MKKEVMALALALAVAGGMIGTALGQDNLQGTPTASASDTQTVADINFLPGNRIDVSPSNGNVDLTLQSGLESVVDDEAMSIDFVFGSLSGSISAEIVDARRGGTSRSLEQLLDLLSDDDGSGDVDGMQLFLCEDVASFSDGNCQALMADDFSAVQSVQVLDAGDVVLGDASPLLGFDGSDNYRKEGGPAQSLKLGAKTIGNGPSEAFDDLAIDLVFTITGSN
ncbi:MAG: hypothetical protein RI554_10570 [Trueperaceae bacterium]|nr:hypothetical protein [Trueperaceae bacterium]